MENKSILSHHTIRHNTPHTKAKRPFYRSLVEFFNAMTATPAMLLAFGAEEEEIVEKIKAFEAGAYLPEISLDLNEPTIFNAAVKKFYPLHSRKRALYSNLVKFFLLCMENVVNGEKFKIAADLVAEDDAELILHAMENIESIADRLHKEEKLAKLNAAIADLKEKVADIENELSDNEDKTAPAPETKEDKTKAVCSMKLNVPADTFGCDIFYAVKEALENIGCEILEFKAESAI